MTSPTKNQHRNNQNGTNEQDNATNKKPTPTTPLPAAPSRTAIRSFVGNQVNPERPRRGSVAYSNVNPNTIISKTLANVGLSALLGMEDVNGNGNAVGKESRDGNDQQQGGERRSSTPPTPLDEETEQMEHFLSKVASVVVLLIFMVVFVAASKFLEVYVVSVFVETGHGPLGMFFIGSYVIWSAYYAFHFNLLRFSSSYRRLNSEEKQFYVLSNLIKSAALLVYTPHAAHVLYQTMYLDEWDTVRLRFMGALYCIPDFVSLFMVKRMTINTKIHHVVVCVFNIFIIYNDFAVQNVFRAIVVYAIWSTFAYLVNLLLAARFVNTSPKIHSYLSLMSLIIYAGCCAINWSWQAWFLSGLFMSKPFQTIAYITLMMMLVYDDIILMKWLGDNVQKNLKTGESSKPSTSGNSDQTKKKKQN